jgi:hypothetical protein
LPDSHITSSNSASLASADDVGVGKILSGSHFLNKELILLHLRN